MNNRAITSITPSAAMIAVVMAIRTLAFLDISKDTVSFT
jgi:hypothetical protein